MEMTKESSSAATIARREWTVADPPPVSYLVVPHGTREWRPSWAPGLIETDLGFDEASGGVFDAVSVRAESGSGAVEGWPYADDDMVWLLVTDGQLELHGEPGVHLVLDRYDAAYLPRAWRPAKYWYSQGFSAIVVRGNFGADTDDLTGPVVSSNGPHSFEALAGGAQRAYFEYRDFGLAALTGGRIALNITRAAGPAPENGTGRHWHTMAQWNVTLTGWYDITVAGHDPRRLPAGDSTFTPTEAIHHVTGYSRDFSILNFTIPAEFDTAEA
jgi:hypothetical protein